MTDKNRNLLVRVATALILLPLVIWLIWLGGVWFALLLGAAAALCALELNLLPASLPPPAQASGEGAVLSGAAIVSMGGAFLIPLLAEVRFWLVTPNLVLAAVLMVAFVDTLLFEEQLANAARRVGLAVLGAVYPGLLVAVTIAHGFTVLL